MQLARSRLIFFLAMWVALAAIGAAYYLECVVELHPCPLCLVQRFFLALFALIALAATLHRPGSKGTRRYGVAGLLCLLPGALASIRQLWLQNHILTLDNICYPDLGYLFKTEPLLSTLKVLALGTPECGQVNWTLLDMSIPEWSLLAFAGLAVLMVSQIFNR